VRHDGSLLHAADSVSFSFQLFLKIKNAWHFLFHVKITFASLYETCVRESILFLSIWHKNFSDLFHRVCVIKKEFYIIIARVILFDFIDSVLT